MGYKTERDFSINKRLRDILESEDKRTSAIADKAGIRRDTFSRILKCKRPLFADEIMPICNAAGIKVDKLFGTERTMKNVG